MASELDDLTKEQLEDIMEGRAPMPEPAPEPAEAATEPEPQQVEAAEPAATEPAAAVEPAASGDEPPPREPDDDPVADFRAQWEAERKALEAKIELQMAHNSRLAGELGYLKQRSSRPEPQQRPDAYAEPDGEGESAALSRVMALETTLRQRDHRAALEQEAIALSQSPEFERVQNDIAAVAPKFQADIQAVHETDDPETARIMVRRVLNAIMAEAGRVVEARERQARMEKRAASVAQMDKAKRIATISASGGVAAPPPKPKTLDDMSLDELDKLMREMTR